MIEFGAEPVSTVGKSERLAVGSRSAAEGKREGSKGGERASGAVALWSLEQFAYWKSCQKA